MPTMPPPTLVSIFLRTRFNIDRTPWIFNMYAPTEHQLDSALMQFNPGDQVTEYEDAVGSTYSLVFHGFTSNNVHI